MVTCANSKLNIGVSECLKAPGLIKGFITTPKDFSITDVDALLPETWETAFKDVKSERSYLWPQWAINSEDISEEEITQETPLTIIGVRPGQYRYKVWFQGNLEQHKEMYSHRNSNGRVFIIDADNQINGTTSDDGATFQGFLLANLLTEKLKRNDGTSVTYTAANLYLADNTEQDERGVLIDAPFVNDLIPLTSVKLAEVGTSTATDIIVSVNSSVDGIAINGLDTADFIVLDDLGVAQVVTVVETGDGVYTLTGTALVTGTVNLVTPDLLSIDAFESTGAIDVTIV